MKYNDGFFGDYDVPFYVLPAYQAAKVTLEGLRLLVQVACLIIAGLLGQE